LSSKTGEIQSSTGVGPAAFHKGWSREYSTRFIVKKKKPKGGTAKERTKFRAGVALEKENRDSGNSDVREQPP